MQLAPAGPVLIAFCRRGGFCLGLIKIKLFFFPHVLVLIRLAGLIGCLFTAQLLLRFFREMS